ncbi:MAG TPA: hypothetical protein VHK69_04550, partial [Chitinophagaceae bacterium]|nr:hypothetical protein [Chitinophagaceae bacterium]
ITPLSLYRQRLSPYVFFGLALFRNNPYTYDSTGLQVFLQPLGTEGQGLPGSGTQLYSRTQLALPFGGGLRFAFNDNVRLGLEVGLRKLFTDYLDDISTNYADAGELLAVRGPRAVSVAYRGDEVPGGNPVYPEKGAQRGNAEYKDWYYFTGLHLSFRLNGKGGSPFGGGRQRLDCPRVPY